MVELEGETDPLKIAMKELKLAGYVYTYMYVYVCSGKGINSNNVSYVCSGKGVNSTNVSYVVVRELTVLMFPM